MVAHPGDTRAVRTAGRLNEPRPARVEANFDGTPWQVNHQSVAVLREEWRVLDRWWTEEPVIRRYFEVVLETGENTVVFHDGAGGGGSPSAAPEPALSAESCRVTDTPNQLPDMTAMATRSRNEIEKRARFALASGERSRATDCRCEHRDAEKPVMY